MNRLAALYTILNAVSNGHYELNERRLRIESNDLVGWQRLEYESLVLVLLVDVSKSTWPFIKVFKEVLASLTDYFSRHNDRIGLISLQGLQARTYSHPTHNFRVVARGLTRLQFHGETPLADGLTKSLSMARIEKSKNPGSRSLVILLSDCYPEPITCQFENKLDEPAYRNSINAAAPYRKAKVLHIRAKSSP
jgi:Mg-chelatase subunit ChlD